MGLVMQFPEQVRNRNERAYDEVLNNIKTKLIGNISIERDLAESLAHEDLSPTDSATGSTRCRAGSGSPSSRAPRSGRLAHHRSR